MAKTNKSESKESKAPAAKAPARKTAGRKPATKAGAGKSASAQGVGQSGPMLPQIDTKLAAQSAVQMLLARKKMTNQPGSTLTVDEIKHDIAQSSGALNKLFHATAPKTSGHTPTSQHVQQGAAVRSQTKAADVNRTNVPRRTAG
ncbi:MAG: hypothetical protein IT448_02330 [Phycisphaerales bacterium]|nr:hypothetical protein [Phycisphaerales bacterium]